MIKFWYQFLVGQFTLYGGGSGGGGPSAPTTQTTQTSNIPEYARPYVETMLGATQQQLFNTKKNPVIPATYDEAGTQITPASGGDVEITGVKPYVPYSTDPNAYVAGFSPLQQQAQKGTAGMQVPGEYGAATDITGQAAAGSMGAAGQVGSLQNQALGYGAAGAQFGGAGAQYGSQGAAEAQRAAALTSAQAAQYGGMGARAGAQNAGISSLYGNLGSQAGQQAAGQSSMYGGLGAQTGLGYGQQAQDPNAVQSFMNPYIQASLNPQLAEIQRQYDITGTQQQSGATKSGAFGGSREALMAAENQRNAGLAKNQLIGQGYNQAFQNAQQQMAQAAQLGMQGAGMGLQGAQQAGAQSMQGYGMGLQGAGQAGQLGIQGAQAGLQGVGAQQAAGQLGLQGTAQGMQGAGMGMQGAQSGLQGVQGAIGAGQYGLQGLGQAGQLGGQLAGIGGQQLQAQQGIYGLQAQIGAQQQAQEQQKINQQIQDYATAQQYPQQQLAFMNAMIRGLPLQTSTTQGYQAPPSAISQLGGLGTAGIAGYKLANMKKGGKVKKMARGGLVNLSLYNATKGLA